jgi:hypothetical protein
VAYCFEAFQKALSRLSPLQSSAIPQSIAHGDVAAFDGFGRFAADSMQPRSDVMSTGAGDRQGLDVRLVMIGDNLIRNHPAALDRLAKERLGTGRIAVLP